MFYDYFGISKLADAPGTLLLLLDDCCFCGRGGGLMC